MYISSFWYLFILHYYSNLIIIVTSIFITNLKMLLSIQALQYLPYMPTIVSSKCRSKNYRMFINYCVFSEFLKMFPTLAFLCFPSVSVCAHTHQAGRKPALQQNWQSSEKSQHFKEKIQYLMKTLIMLRIQHISSSKWSEHWHVHSTKFLLWSHCPYDNDKSMRKYSITK